MGQRNSRSSASPLTIEEKEYNLEAFQKSAAKGEKLYSALISDYELGMEILGLKLENLATEIPLSPESNGWVLKTNGELWVDFDHVDHIWRQFGQENRYCCSLSWLHETTGAFHHSLLAIGGGLLVALNNRSLASTSKHGTNTTLPAVVHHWSDLVWLDIIRFNNPRDLEFVWRHTISNPETYATIIHALESMGKTPTNKGHYFEITSGNAKAILGSPNGQGLAYLLVQNKGELADKMIKGVWVFAEEEEEEKPEKVWVQFPNPVGSRSKQALHLLFVLTK